MITRDVLAKLCPRPKSGPKAKIWDGYVDAIVSDDGRDLFQKYGVTTKLRQAHILAQWAHECSGFQIIWESRIQQIFGVGRHSAAVTANEARALAGNGYALFERVYGLGNPRKARELGNTQKGDGWRFRGCSITQLTGRDAHTRYAAKIGCGLDEIEKPINGIHGALLEWKEKNCNAAADADDVVSVTKKINGGRNGLAERRTYLAKAKKLLASEPEVKSKTPADRKPEVVLGDEGYDVRKVQELLVRAGYVIPIDGQAGKRTEGAIAAFQVNNGLTGTGVVNDETWDLLESAAPAAPREVDEKVLKDGSKTIQLWSKILMLGRTIYLTVAGILASLYAMVFGSPDPNAPAMEVAEQSVSNFDRIASFVERLGVPTGLLLLALVLVGFVGWLLARSAKTGIAVRVEDARNGSNLSL
jgi:putative chitinase